MVTSSTRRIAGLVCGFLFACLSAAPAFSQDLPPFPETANLSGPRFGLTVLSPGIVNALGVRGIYIRPALTQFGWQWERQFFTRDSGVTMVTEWVTLLGGLDQGIALPSFSWLVGLRNHQGVEFGLGPNVTPAGFALVLAAGTTLRTRAFNVPINVAFVPSRSGSRISILTGFTLRR